MVPNLVKTKTENLDVMVYLRTITRGRSRRQTGGRFQRLNLPWGGVGRNNSRSRKGDNGLHFLAKDSGKTFCGEPPEAGGGGEVHTQIINDRAWVQRKE